MFELPRDDSHLPMQWQDLGEGAPTIAAFARLCAQALVSGTQDTEGLSTEAKAILYAARRRGVLEIRGKNNAFEAPERFLAVQVELDAENTFSFRSREDITLSIRFLDGFRQLCAQGLILHHLFRDFSLSRAGLELAQRIPRTEVAALLDPLAEEQTMEV